MGTCSFQRRTDSCVVSWPERNRGVQFFKIRIQLIKCRGTLVPSSELTETNPGTLGKAGTPWAQLCWLKPSKRNVTWQGWISGLCQHCLHIAKIYISRNSATSLVGRHRSCGNITILSSVAFYPFKVGDIWTIVLNYFNTIFVVENLTMENCHALFQANERTELFRSEPDQFWTKKFQRTYSVHFFGQITSGRWPQIISEKGKATQTHSRFTQEWVVDKRSLSNTFTGMVGWLGTREAPKVHFFKHCSNGIWQQKSIAEHFYAPISSFYSKYPKIATDKDYRACDLYLMSWESRPSRVATFMSRGWSCVWYHT